MNAAHGEPRESGPDRGHEGEAPAASDRASRPVALQASQASEASEASQTSRVSENATYLSFWNEVGTHFPSLKGAASTDYYFECERILVEDHFPSLGRAAVLKTDLWDEAKNTEILRWAAEQGARPFGVDLSLEVVAEARRVCAAHDPGFVVADIRALPFRSDRFDHIYSMGTIEHFDDSEGAVREITRVLRPAGTAIIGVPNRLDPFLRPLLVALLDRFGLYAYGMEKSYTPGGLRRLVESGGLRVRGQSGILFIPGALRMADLWLHTRRSRLARLTGLMVQPFAWLYRRVRSLRRHGYLIAALAEKVDSRSASC